MASAIGRILSSMENVILSRPFQTVLIAGCGAASCYFYAMRKRRKVVLDLNFSSDSSNLPKTDASDNVETSDNLDSSVSSLDRSLLPRPDLESTPASVVLAQPGPSSAGTTKKENPGATPREVPGPSDAGATSQENPGPSTAGAASREDSGPGDVGATSEENPGPSNAGAALPEDPGASGAGAASRRDDDDWSSSMDISDSNSEPMRGTEMIALSRSDSDEDCSGIDLFLHRVGDTGDELSSDFSDEVF